MIRRAASQGATVIFRQRLRALLCRYASSCSSCQVLQRRSTIERTRFRGMWLILALHFGRRSRPSSRPVQFSRSIRLSRAPCARSKKLAFAQCVCINTSVPPRYQTDNHGEQAAPPNQNRRLHTAVESPCREYSNYTRPSHIFVLLSREDGADSHKPLDRGSSGVNYGDMCGPLVVAATSGMTRGDKSEPHFIPDTRAPTMRDPEQLPKNASSSHYRSGRRRSVRVPSYSFHGNVLKKGSLRCRN